MHPSRSRWLPPHRHATDLVDVLEHVAWNNAQVAEVDVSHAHLWCATRTPLAQETRLIVQIAEPHGPAGNGVAVDGGLCILDRLQTHRLPISTPQHLEVHIELGSNRIVDELAEFVHSIAALLLRERLQEVEVEVRH
eukprot:scaffold225569_cov32-Tisochrysis_lutea.AAC.3